MAELGHDSPRESVIAEDALKLDGLAQRCCDRDSDQPKIRAGRNGVNVRLGAERDCHRSLVNLSVGHIESGSVDFRETGAGVAVKIISADVGKIAAISAGGR